MKAALKSKKTAPFKVSGRFRRFAHFTHVQSFLKNPLPAFQ